MLKVGTIETILQKYPKAKRTAVENYLLSLTGDRLADSMNVSLDSRLYGWNIQTVSAIKMGIRIAYQMEGSYELP